MRIAWYVAALGAAVVWGVHYPLIEYALKRISLYGTLFLTILGIALVAPLFHADLSHDWQTLFALPTRERLLILAIPLTTLIASALLYLSIDDKNATLASLLEISYPVFVAAFTFVLFREHHLNTLVVAGGLLVFAGVSLIIVSQR